MGSELQVNSWLKIESSSRLRTENDSGELQIENYSIRLWMENNSGWLQMQKVSGERFAAGGELQWSASNEEWWWLSTKNDSGELQKNYSIRL